MLNFIVFALFGFFSTVPNNSKPIVDLPCTEELNNFCPAASEIILHLYPTNRPIREVKGNTTYDVFMLTSGVGLGGMYANSGYTIVYGGCRDITPYEYSYIGRIKTSSNVSSGISIPTFTDCTSPFSCGIPANRTFNFPGRF